MTKNQAKAMINLAPGLSVPLEMVTEVLSILGRRGSGKTHTASVLAEEMLAHGVQVVIIDPLDVWNGLQSSADGKSDGFAIAVFGGEHADVPLEATDGERAADAIIEMGVSAIISVSHLSKTEQRRLVGEFCERLYHRKAKQEFRKPLCLYVDEADAFVPQRIPPGGERCYGALDTIVRRGRARGFGVCLISQRAAVLAKDVLTQSEVLVCHQTNGPQDAAALRAWIEQHDDGGHQKEFLASLPTLEKGEAWVWSPGSLGLFQRVKVRRRKTFDSSFTPALGAAKLSPTKVAKVDLAALRERLEAALEPEEPKALQFGKAKKGKAAEPLYTPSAQERIKALTVELEETRAERDRFRAIVLAYQELDTNGALDHLNAAVAQLREVAECISWPKAEARAKARATGGILATLDSSGAMTAEKLPPHSDVAKVLEQAEQRLGLVPPAPVVPAGQLSPEPNRPASQTRGIDKEKPGRLLPKLAQSRPADMSPGEWAVLCAVVHSYPRASTATLIGLLTDYRPSSRKEYIRQLRKRGLVASDSYTATKAGLAMCPAPQLPTGRALLEHWVGQLSPAAGRMLQAIAASRDGLGLGEVQQATGLKPSSTKEYLRQLRIRGLVVTTAGVNRLSPHLTG